MNKYLLYILLTLPFFNNIFSQSFQTFSFPAEIEDTQTLNAEISMCLDKQNKTHIAWIRNLSQGPQVMHTVFNPSTETFTTQSIDITNFNNVVAPYIITDENDNPHITYLIQRVADNNRTGNYGIMYAGDSNGDKTFEISQVSTNPSNPKINPDGVFQCSNNGRPSLFIDNGKIVVSYGSSSNEATGYDNYLIFAKKEGNNWSHKAEFNIDETVEGTFDSDNGFNLPRTTNSGRYCSTIEISNYSPRFIYQNSSTSNWNDSEILGYRGTFANENEQLTEDILGNVHYTWFNDMNNKFCHTTLRNGSFNQVTEYSISHNASGNLFPNTVDINTGEPVFAYKRSFRDMYLVTTFDGEFNEIPIGEIGISYGRKSIGANKGYISLVTASESDQRIYLTIAEQGNTSGSTPPNNECATPININSLFNGNINSPIVSQIFDNTNANSAPTDPNSGYDCFFNQELSKTLWFNFTGDGSGYRIRTRDCNSNNYITGGDTQMALFRGNSCNNLTPIACNDDFDLNNDLYYSNIEIPTENGQDYTMLIDGCNCWTDADDNQFTSFGEFCIEVTKLGPSSTETISDDDRIHFYPNPTSSEIFVDFDFENQQVSQITLIDAVGKIIQVQEVEDLRSGKLLLDVKNHSNGIYYLIVKSDKGVFTDRLIIQR